MKPDVLVNGQQMPHVMEVLEKDYTLFKLHEAKNPDAFLKELAPRVRAIATGGHHGASAALIDALPNLKIISSVGVGTDAIDVAYAKKRGVAVCNTPGVLDDDVANLAITLLLAVTRKFIAYDRYVREGRWVKDGLPPLTHTIAGSKVGMLGMGRIGQAIAEKLKVFHCEVAYHTRSPRPDLPYRHYPDLAKLAADSNVLVVIVPGGGGTEKLVDRRVLDALGPQGVLINIARGSVVDEPALVAALREGRLGGAGLDVFADEPNVPAALFAMENVVLQPHQGSATVETRRAMGDLMLANLAAFFAGKALLSPLP
jgi:lactate dehydrogenase-like 2-hydroxyacid dehydrogenase